MLARTPSFRREKKAQHHASVAMTAFMNGVNRLLGQALTVEVCHPPPPPPCHGLCSLITSVHALLHQEAEELKKQLALEGEHYIAWSLLDEWLDKFEPTLHKAERAQRGLEDYLLGNDNATARLGRLTPCSSSVTVVGSVTHLSLCSSAASARHALVDRAWFKCLRTKQGAQSLVTADIADILSRQCNMRLSEDAMFLVMEELAPHGHKVWRWCGTMHHPCPAQLSLLWPWPSHSILHTSTLCHGRSWTPSCSMPSSAAMRT